MYGYLLTWWTVIIVFRMINTPGHVLSSGWPLCKRSGLTLIEVSQHAYLSYQALVYFWFTTMLIFATWCNWRDFYWCWIKFCLSLSLSLSLSSRAVKMPNRFQRGKGKTKFWSPTFQNLAQDLTIICLVLYWNGPAGPIWWPLVGHGYLLVNRIIL